MNGSSYWQRKVTGPGLGRRAFLHSAAVTGAGTAAFLAGCRGSAPDKPASGTSGGATTGAGAALWAVPEAKYGGTLTSSFSYEPTGWDPQSSPGAGQGATIEAFSIKLIRHDYRRTPPWHNGAETLLMGELAEKWENPDPLTYTFKLRQGINWPDQEPMKGRPITAQDVAYTFAHAKTPAAVVQSYVFDPIDKVTAIDDKTVQFKLKTPNWLFLSSMNTYSTQLLPRGIYEWTGPGAWTADNARGGGAWIIDQYRPSSFVSYKPNPAYKKVFGVPYADKLMLTIYPGGGAPVLQAFATKQIYKMSIPAGQVDVVKKARPDAKMKLDIYAATSTSALFIKTTDAPFADVRVRRAISMAVDRDGWGKTLQVPYKLESGPITWGFADYKMDLSKMPADVQGYAKYNRADAAKLVQAAGVSSSKSYTIHVYPTATYVSDGQLMVDSLKAIGVTSSLKTYDYNNFIAEVYYTLDPKTWSGMLIGPDNLDRYQQQLSDRFSKTSNRNHSFVNDPQMEQWLSDFSAAKGAADAQPISNNIQQRSVDQAYAVYKPQGTSPIAWDPSVQNFEGETEFLYQNSFRDAFLWIA